MNVIKHVFIFSMFFLIITSCGGDSSSPGNTTSGGKFVSQKDGSDSGDGSKKHPYKTISYALSQVRKGVTIYIAEGDYSSENGEVFPLNLRKGIKLFKYNSSLTEVVNIKGFGQSIEKKPVSIILNGDNELNGISLNSLDNIGILSNEGNNVIINSEITNNSVGVGVTGESKLSLVNTLIINNSHAGIELSGKSVLNLLASKINRNQIGIIISDKSKIGFDVNQSSQNNEIMKNIKCDLFHEGNQDLQLSEITWDEDVFKFTISSNCSNGNNIVNIGNASIDYQYIPSQKTTLFLAEKSINIVAPNFGDTIYSTTPDFIYNATGNKLLMIAIWKSPPIVRANKIINVKEIIWFWHSGMKGSPIGSVSYNAGRPPVNGNLNPLDNITIPPQPLERGRSYYFAIWEWDVDGVNIVASSKESYFKVAQ